MILIAHKANPATTCGLEIDPDAMARAVSSSFIGAGEGAGIVAPPGRTFKKRIQKETERDRDIPQRTLEYFGGTNYISVTELNRTYPMLHPEPKERITVHIPSSLRKEICEKADAAGQTLSVWVERAMKSYLSSEVEA